jgi:hypothetical protein
MSTNDTGAEETSATDARRIDGPIAERDKFDRLTGYRYDRCRACGREAMRASDLDDCCVAAMAESAGGHA